VTMGTNGEGTFLSPANIKNGGWKTSAPVIDLSAEARRAKEETDMVLKEILEKNGV
jgi:hypothetical protein